ncbi:uncharacterized protein LOC123317850 [Coccinella septempunctata]|uniref:uncharacterized protein LOC123317850 n=1 Tax=Coccinella septempunctata TaxID=41139 RepID=UPI001D0988EA|nr:uncharacterized protein LOC123317850 [Coccinella septempunctata]
MCANFNLKDNQVADLANYMGHTEKIHKEIYRQPVLTREIVHISKLLEAVQENDGEDSEDDSDTDWNLVSCNTDKLVSCSSTIANDSKEATSTTSQSMEIDFQLEEAVISTPSPNVKCRRIRWSEEEKRIASEAFKEYILNNTLSSFQKIQEVMNANPGVFHRSVATIKTWVKNEQLKEIKRGN